MNPLQPAPRGQQQVALTENDTTPIVCQNMVLVGDSVCVPSDIGAAHVRCGGELFDIAYRMRTLSHLSPKNPTGKDMAIKIETFVCRACGCEVGAKTKGENV